MLLGEVTNEWIAVWREGISAAVQIATLFAGVAGVFAAAASAYVAYLTKRAVQKGAEQAAKDAAAAAARREETKQELMARNKMNDAKLEEVAVKVEDVKNAANGITMRLVESTRAAGELKGAETERERARVQLLEDDASKPFGDS